MQWVNGSSEAEQRRWRAQRRAAIRRLAPAFTSERLVDLYEAILMLALRQPERLKTVQVIVERLVARPVAAKAELPTERSSKLA